MFLLEVDVMSREEAGSGSPGPGHGQVLRLRMSPHNVAEVSRVEMLADCPIDHPFFVKDKGECSRQCQSCVFSDNVCFIAGLSRVKYSPSERHSHDKKVDTVRI